MFSISDLAIPMLSVENARRLKTKIAAAWRYPLSSSRRKRYRASKFEAEQIQSVNSRKLPDRIAKQILRQARHDPSILAAGAKAIESLRTFDSGNLMDRQSLDVERIFAHFPRKADAILIIPFISVGGAEKYAANIASALIKLGMREIAVIVTDQRAQDSPDLNSFSIFDGFRSAKVLYWKEFCGWASTSEVVLASLLNAIRPRRVIVINSRVGLDAISRFGNGLSQFSKLYCAYFGLGVNGLGAPYGAYYPRKTMAYSVTLTDNHATSSKLQHLFGDLPNAGILVLPPACPTVDVSVFEKRLETQKSRVLRRERPYRWLWISRVEPFKGTGILARIAKKRPHDIFDVFGPLEHSLEALGLNQRNIVYRGVLKDVQSANLSSYDAFLFTSLFEGMPNVVLELAQHAVPMILARVGGIPDTFDDKAAFTFSSDNEEAAVDLILAAFDKIVSFSAEECGAMVSAAWKRALEHHSEAVFMKNVAELLVNHEQS